MILLTCPQCGSPDIVTVTGKRYLGQSACNTYPLCMWFGDSADLVPKDFPDDKDDETLGIVRGIN